MATSRPLIIGNPDDEHVRAVIAAIGDAAEPLVFDAAILSERGYVADAHRLEIGGAMPMTVQFAGTLGWVRRLAPPGWAKATVSGSQQAAERGAWLALVVGLSSHPDVRWLSAYRAMAETENKLVQLAHAQRLGVPTPPTVVSSSPACLPAGVGESVVVKPLGVGHFVDDDGEPRVVWAESMARRDPRLDALAAAPFLVQARLTARRHLRVVTVGTRVWACALLAHDAPLDWRRDEAAHHSFEPTSVPLVEERAAQIARHFGLGYSSQDWIETDDETYFIDLNPAGQWLFLPEPVSEAVTAAVAEHLVAS